jgi:hypothetical protein
MKSDLLWDIDAWKISLVLFILMLIVTIFGKIIGKKIRENKKSEKNLTETTGITGLLFFLLAFTFGMSGAGYVTRKATVVEEATNICTAILRSDMYPDAERTLFRKDFKEYLEARIQFYEVGYNRKKMLDSDRLAQTISSRLWKRASDLSKNPINLAATQQMIPALNMMINSPIYRLEGERAKVPESIVIMLCLLSLISAFYSGYTEGRKGKIDWLVQIGFCVLISLVTLFTFDLDRPRRGFVSLDNQNKTIIELRKLFN